MVKSDFYSEIFENEKKWKQLIDKGLLNSVYCNLTLKPFYQKKKQILEKEIGLNNNELIKQIIMIINDIIIEIDSLNYKYVNYQKPNINNLLPLFLTSKMNNTTYHEKNTNINKTDEKEQLRNKKQILEQIISNCYNIDKDIPDYVYEDFPEEVSMKK